MEPAGHLCSSCGREMPASPLGTCPDRAITGEVCEECLRGIDAEAGTPLADFLDRLAAPVVLVDSDVTVKAANKLVRNLLGKDNSRIRGYKGGDVFECAYARLPGGCGQTLHCSGCAIRRSVTETFATGKTLRRVPATLHKQLPAEIQQLYMLISTEKAWNMVLLKIDYVGPAQDPLQRH